MQHVAAGLCLLAIAGAAQCDPADTARACIADARQQHPTDDIALIIDRCLPAHESEAWDKAEKEFTKRQLAKQKAADAWAARPKSVHLGMSADEVRKTQWGKPQEINSSVGRYGTREQWVYGSGNYLYFEDGKLTTIQRSK